MRSSQTDGFGEGDDDLVVVGNVLISRGTARFAFFWATILEPLFTDLVPADMKVPNFF